jgi:hypothetical protein
MFIFKLSIKQVVFSNLFFFKKKKHIVETTKFWTFDFFLITNIKRNHMKVGRDGILESCRIRGSTFHLR